MLTNIEAIKLAKLEYISDIEWGYKYEDQFKCIDFYKDENGKNHIEKFLHKHNGMWIEITPTDEETKLMFQILNDTPYRESEEIQGETITDLYDYNGVKRENFY